MTFAYGRGTRRRVISALANLRNFQGSERSALSEGLTGLNGPCRRLTNSRYGALPREYAVGLDTAVYVVYCHGTPIAWVTADDEDATEDRNNWIPDWQYSATTTYYQSLVMEAWGRFYDPDPRKSRRDNKGSARGRTSDARYGRGGQEPTAVAHARRVAEYATARERQPADQDRFRTNHRGVRYDALVERDTSYERDMAEARAQGQPSHTAPSGPPEREMTREEYLRDPRLKDPSWTPWGAGGNNLPAGADYRDQRRVESEGEWRP